MNAIRATSIALLVTATVACGGMRAGNEGARSARPREAPQAAMNLGAYVSYELDRLEDDLRLSSQQRGAWNAYAEKVQELATAVARTRFDARGGREAEGTAAEQLDRLTATERERIGRVEAIASAGKALYRELDADQRAIADRRLAAPLRFMLTGTAPPVSLEELELRRRRR